MGKANVGSIYLQIAADVASLRSDMDQAKGILKNTTDEMVSMAKTAAISIGAAFTIHALKENMGAALDFAESLNHVRQSAGMSADQLYSLSASAKLADIDFQTLTGMTSKFSKGIGEAEMGSGKAKNALDNMGISIKDSSGHLKDNFTLIGEVSDKFVGMHDGAEKTTLAMGLFGKSGAAMIPVLNSGKESLQEYLGVMDNETAQAAENFNDSMTRISMSMDSVYTQMIATLAPTLNAIANDFNDVSKEGRKTGHTLGEELGEGMKVAIELAYQVAASFSVAGHIIGNFGAAASMLATGDLSGAKFAWDQIGKDIDKDEKDWNARIEKIHNAKLTDIKSETGNNGADREELKSFIPVHIKTDKAAEEFKKFMEKMNLELAKDPIDPFQGIMAKYDDAQNIIAKMHPKDRPSAETALMKVTTKEVDTAWALYEKKATEAIDGVQSRLSSLNGDYAKSINDTYAKDIANANTLLNTIDQENMKKLAGHVRDKSLSKEKQSRDLKYYQAVGDAGNAWAMQETSLRNQLFGLTTSQQDTILMHEKRNFDEQIANDTNRLKFMHTMDEGIKFYLQRLQFETKNSAQNMVAIMDTMSSSMNSAFGNFFDNSSKGFLDFGSLATQVLTDVEKQIMQMYVISPVVNALMGGISSYASGAFGGTGGGVVGSNGSSYTSASPTFDLTQKWDGGQVGFASGGYTGDGDKYAPKGVVHGGEYVLPKWMVTQNPALVSVLESARQRGYTDGGIVGGSINSSGGQNMKVEIINNTGQQAQITSTSQKFDGQQMILSVVMDGYSRNVGGMRDMLGGGR